MKYYTFTWDGYFIILPEKMMIDNKLCYVSEHNISTENITTYYHIVGLKDYYIITFRKGNKILYKNNFHSKNAFRIPWLNRLKLGI